MCSELQIHSFQQATALIVLFSNQISTLTCIRWKLNEQKLFVFFKWRGDASLAHTPRHGTQAGCVFSCYWLLVDFILVPIFKFGNFDKAVFIESELL